MNTRTLAVLAGAVMALAGGFSSDANARMPGDALICFQSDGRTVCQSVYVARSENCRNLPEHLRRLGCGEDLLPVPPRRQAVLVAPNQPLPPAPGGAAGAAAAAASDPAGRPYEGEGNGGGGNGGGGGGSQR